MRTFELIATSLFPTLALTVDRPEHIPFQQMVEKHYADMKKKVREYLEPKDAPTPLPASDVTPGE